MIRIMMITMMGSEQCNENICHQDEELWFNDEEDFDEEGSGPVLGPGGLGEPTKASCTSVSTTSPQVGICCYEKLLVTLLLS